MFKRRFIRLLCLGIFSGNSFGVEKNSEKYPSFEKSLGMKVLNGDRNYTNKKTNTIYSESMLQYKALYTDNYLSNMLLSGIENIKIPRIIHQIWLGSPLPDHYKEWQKTWQFLHPDWEYKLWTDKDVQSLCMINKDLFDASENYGEKSDIMRCEILYQQGGVYVDVDFECIRPLDILHYAYDFYSGIMLPAAVRVVGNAIIGARAGHPILKHYLDNLHARWHDPKNKNSIVSRTGPHAVEQALNYFINTASTQEKKNIIVLPPTYFFPWPPDKRVLGYKDVCNFIRPETFAVHYWTMSWGKPKSKILYNTVKTP